MAFNAWFAEYKWPVLGDGDVGKEEGHEVTFTCSFMLPLNM